jgi:Zn-dependent protease with chaperone function
MRTLTRSLALALSLALPAREAAWAVEIVRAAAVPALAPVAAVPALPALSAIAAPVPQTSGAVEHTAALNARWEGTAARPAAAEPVAASASAAEPALPAPTLPPSAPGPTVPAPRVPRARAAMAAGWTALAGVGALAHVPFDKLGPLAVGGFMGLCVGYMAAYLTMAAQQDPGGGWRRGPAPKPRVVSEEQRSVFGSELAQVARRHGLPPPARLTFVENEFVQASAGGSPGDYEVRLYGGTLDLPADQREAVYGHELAHVVHGDSAWSAAQIFLASIGPALALVAGAVVDWRAYLALPMALVAFLGVQHGKRVDEYLADQRSAHLQRTTEPLKRFFREDLARDAAEEPALGPIKRAWRRLSWLLSNHPTHEQRIARLERLEEKPR